MARRLRIEYPDAWYHATNRGIDRRVLFADTRDYEAFLDDLQEAVELHEVDVHAFSLLPNHFHLLLQTPRANLSAFMQALQTRYAVYFNLRHGKRGHVFQGPYTGVPVEEDDYLLKLSRYVHLNPVKTRAFQGKPMKDILRSLRSYKWSSYRGYIGLEKRKEWVRYDVLEEQVRSRFGRQKGIYRKYVESGLAETDEELEEAMKGGGLAIGRAEFVEEMKERYRRMREKSKRRAEDISLRKERRAVPPEEIVERVCEVLGIDKEKLLQRRGGGAYRGLAAKMLIKYGRLTQREAAVYLNVSTGAAVSIRIREADRAVRGDRTWRRKASSIEGVLMRSGKA